MLNQPLLIMKTRTKAHTRKNRREKKKDRLKTYYDAVSETFGYHRKLNPSAVHFCKNAKPDLHYTQWQLPI